jgi:hypothetical protein
MCINILAASGPLLYAQLAIAALSTGASFISQQQQASAANAAAKSEAESAAAAARNQYYLNNLRLQQTAEATSQDVQRRQTETLKAMGTAATAAGEAGVAGISVDALLADYARAEAQYREVQATNLENAAQQTAANQTGIYYQAVDRTNQARSMRQAGPDYIGSALGLADKVADIYYKRKLIKSAINTGYYNTGYYSAGYYNTGYYNIGAIY